MILGAFCSLFCYELSTAIVFTSVNLFWIWYSIVDNFCPKKCPFRWEMSFYFDELLSEWSVKSLSLQSKSIAISSKKHSYCIQISLFLHCEIMKVQCQLYLLLDVKLGENDVVNNDFLLRKSGLVGRKTMKMREFALLKVSKKSKIGTWKG